MELEILFISLSIIFIGMLYLLFPSAILRWNAFAISIYPGGKYIPSPRSKSNLRIMRLLIVIFGLLIMIAGLLGLK